MGQAEGGFHTSRGRGKGAAGPGAEHQSPGGTEKGSTQGGSCTGCHPKAAEKDNHLWGVQHRVRAHMKGWQHGGARDRAREEGAQRGGQSPSWVRKGHIEGQPESAGGPAGMRVGRVTVQRRRQRRREISYV